MEDLVALAMLYTQMTLSTFATHLSLTILTAAVLVFKLAPVPCFSRFPQ